MKTTRIATLGLLIVAFSGCQTVNQKSVRRTSLGPQTQSVSSTAARPSATSNELEKAKQPTAGLIRQVGFQEDAEDKAEKEAADRDETSEAPELQFESSPIASTIEVTQSSPISTSLAEIEQTALATNPAVAEIVAEIQSLRGKLTQAGLPFNPTAGVTGVDINEERGGGRYGVYLGQQVIRGNKLGYARSVVCAEIASAEQRLAIIQQRLLTDVRKRYYDLLIAQETVSTTDELVKISQNAVDVSEQLLEAEEVAQTAVLQSDLELQAATVAKQRAENQRLAARRKLAGLMGESDLALDNVGGNAREMLTLTEFEQSYDEIVNNSPEVAALFAEVEEKRRQLSREIVEPIPNVTWQTSLEYDTVSDNVIPGFQIGMPIPILNRNQGAIHQARYQIVAAERRAEKKALDLRQRLATAYEGYLDAKLQIDAFEAKILPTAKQTLDLVTKGYEQGETDFLQLLTAQRTYSQINLTYLSQLQQVWRQRVEIDGMLLSGSLE